ncbi:DUF6461 domain-containing protein [Streptomonospora wellingtoniae]|uniref:DUF6461 domain-containing protein n=1 Tax=Streptomonospora wellingtoniae TaxID=3075544 RepID=A0ABU2KVW0_9ACTN|nr:DUF6461 domain-containing protein [Streptomonospora sp. DSM 45055]MDT0303341.1 DUF6461 domain-containing protein [Streptomonospora sp. DSM 45055]
MAVALARDYAWLRETQPDLAEAYCLSYVRGLGKAAALGRLGVAERDMRCLPIAEAVEAALCCADDRPPMTVHALAVGGWTVIIEPTGCRATRPECYRALSAETELVSVRVLMDHRYEFRWVIDGVLQTFFDARTPRVRRGTRPDSLEAQMGAVGLGGTAAETEPAAAVLALADRVTGVRIRSSHLAGPLLGAELDSALPLTPR